MLYQQQNRSFENLIKYGFIENKTIENRTLVFKTIDLNNQEYNYANLIRDLEGGVYYVDFYGCIPRAIYTLQFLDNKGSVDISIPSNGYYHVNIYDTPLVAISLKSLPYEIQTPTGYIDVGYHDIAGVGDFSQIRKVSVKNKYYDYYGASGGNLLDSITHNDKKFKLGFIYDLKIETREIRRVYKVNGGYSDVVNGNPIYLNPQYIFEVYDSSRKQIGWVDGSTRQETNEPTYGLTIEFEGDTEQRVIDLKYPDDNRGGIFERENIDDLKYLHLSNGLHLYMSYQEKEYIYAVEEDDKTVIAAKEKWLNDPTDGNYNDFMSALTNALRRES